MNFLITGTDTGVGKTYVTAGVIRSARSSGLDWIGMKPICAGDPDDVTALMLAAGQSEPEHLINPYRFQVPLAPYAASIVEGRPLDLVAVREAYHQLAARHALVLVEGAGGLLVPILAGYDFRDLAQDLKLSALVVAANRLGALNHILLTLDALRSHDINCRGIVLNRVSPEENLAQQTNRSILESLVTVPVLELEYRQQDFSAIQEWLASAERY